LSWIVHLLLALSSEEDRRVRPGLLWAGAVLLAFGVVWAWMIPTGGDPQVPAALVWIARGGLSLVFVAVLGAAMRASA
jgi:energy-converting hydrogenase Eha subunit E